MAEYVAKYKCRRCGETFGCMATGNKGIAYKVTIELSLKGESSMPSSPSLHMAHTCKDDGVGFVDFIGWDSNKNG